MSENGMPRSWLTSEVRMDPFLLDDARQAYSDRGGGRNGYLAARRLLDDRLCQMVHWPRELDYAQLADDLAAVGRDEDATLLRRVAATGALLTEAQDRWNTRYATRAQTTGNREAHRLIDAGLIDFNPDGPYPGIDGSLYWPGYTSLETGNDQVPVIVVGGRGMWQLVTGFEDQPAAAHWLHDRGPIASGPLTPPDVPSLPRAVLEEHILERMLCSPGDLPASMASLPPTTFTADARYDIYAAIITAAAGGQPWGLSQVAAELGRRMDWIPEWALPRYGGQGAPWAQAYLRRLADTEPLSYPVPRLIADDMQARLRSEGPEAAAQRPALPVSRPCVMPGNDQQHQRTSDARPDAIPETWGLPPQPGPDGPVPRM